MATPLDLGLFEHFRVIFPLMLIFVLIYAIMQVSKVFGDNKSLHALIAFCIAALFLFIPGLTDVLGYMIPWFVIVFVVIFIFMLALKFMGASDKAITDYMSVWSTPHWFFMAFAIIIVMGSIAAVYGDALLPYTTNSSDGDILVGAENFSSSTSTGDFNSNVGRVIFHPKVIGLVFIFAVASFTIRFMAGGPSK